jgi:hypothetical protein
MTYSDFMKRLITFLTLLTLASPALAQEKAKEKAQAPLPRYVVECRGPFARSATHADLVKVYGAKNVSFEDVNRAEGETVKATVLFKKSDVRRLEIEWYDGKKRARPSVITVFGAMNQWTGPLGIRNGMTIQEIEKRAGKPFRINGFAFDVAGAGHFADTKLEKLPGGCEFGGHFEIEGGQPPEHLKRFIGEVEIDSNDPDLLTLKPKLWIWSLRYPPAH